MEVLGLHNWTIQMKNLRIQSSNKNSKRILKVFFSKRRVFFSKLLAGKTNMAKAKGKHHHLKDQMPVWTWWMKPAGQLCSEGSDLLTSCRITPCISFNKKTAECYKIGPLPLISRMITSFITLRGPISYRGSGAAAIRTSGWLSLPNSSCSRSSLPSASTWQFSEKFSWCKSRQWTKKKLAILWQKN